MAFRLWRLLRLAERQEQHCVLIYKEAYMWQQKVRVQVEALEQQWLTAGYMTGVVVGARLRSRWAHRSFLLEQLQQAKETLHRADIATDSARDELLSARQRRKTLEKLKEKHDTEQRSVLARKEQELLDEAGLRGYQVSEHSV